MSSLIGLGVMDRLFCRPSAATAIHKTSRSPIEAWLISRQRILPAPRPRRIDHQTLSSTPFLQQLPLVLQRRQSNEDADQLDSSLLRDHAQVTDQHALRPALPWSPRKPHFSHGQIPPLELQVARRIRGLNTYRLPCPHFSQPYQPLHPAPVHQALQQQPARP